MSNYVNVATIETVVEAQLLESILRERTIPHVIHSFHDAAFDGMYQLQKGWGCVAAPEEYRKMVLYILSDLRKDASLA